ncbi:hypothetical protein CL654_03385 [bacterium]|nr:hypothetical protein [bacterium]|tara:strand:- start:1029 stop:1529 length:501 start_codon:yes stop_codon:yes gene_type:complete
MRQFLNILWFGIREPFKNKNYTFLFLSLLFIFFALFVLIPVRTVSGNTLATQLDIFTGRDYTVLILLSSLSALFITMQVYVMRQKRKVSGVGTATVGGLGALFAGIAGTAFCASCLAPLFAIFGIGFGGTLFVLEYRWYFVVAIILFMLIAIYLTARKMRRVCNSC